jgi:hypothetical protein
LQNPLRIGQQVTIFADNIHDICGQKFESKMQATYLGYFLDTGTNEMQEVYKYRAPIACPHCGGEVQHLCVPVNMGFYLTNLGQVKGLKSVS